LFVVNVDLHKITGSVVRPDFFSCIELTMAIVFAPVAGIAGREAISNFVNRFMVPRTTKAGDGGHNNGVRYSRPDIREIRMADSRTWLKANASVEESLVVKVEEIHDV